MRLNTERLIELDEYVESRLDRPIEAAHFQDVVDALTRMRLDEINYETEYFEPIHREGAPEWDSAEGVRLEQRCDTAYSKACAWGLTAANLLVSWTR